MGSASWQRMYRFHGEIVVSVTGKSRFGAAAPLHRRSMGGARVDDVDKNSPEGISPGAFDRALGMVSRRNERPDRVLGLVCSPYAACFDLYSDGDEPNCSRKHLAKYERLVKPTE